LLLQLLVVAHNKLKVKSLKLNGTNELLDCQAQPVIVMPINSWIVGKLGDTSHVAAEISIKSEDVI
jgi:hypothetical protein